ncbi:MAG: hypothetical protein HZA31_07890 [Opitutae bacterium]|nr:hypothetical protein [Opitutae bacterium]
MKYRPTWLVLPVLCASLPLGAAEGTLTNESPFLSAGTSAAAVIENAPLQLAGITIIEPKTYVCLVDATKNRGRWLAVGTKIDELEVISCDTVREEAVVRVGAETKTLPLRKPASSKGGIASKVPEPAPSIPNVGPAGGALPPVAPLLTREAQEREARMLVSDLLEIGMRQRKAYEEAQRKAAAEAAAKGGAAKP